MLECIEEGILSNTTRDTNRLMNRFLRRDELSSIAIRTMTDVVERDGIEYHKAQKDWCDKSLESYGWNPETGKPREETIIDSEIVNPNLQSVDVNGKILTSKERKAIIEELVHSINEKRTDNAKIPESSVKPFQVEDSSKSAVYVSLDGVNAKRQKDQRSVNNKDDRKIYTHDTKDGPVDYSRAPDPKKRPAVETAVAHIQIDDKKYLFAAENMFSVCLLVIAFLLTKGVLKNRKLVFFTDGGKDIRSCIQGMFAFCHPVVVLDWFHLRKHCNEVLSMMLVGGKANRNMQYEVRRTLYYILWTGNVSAAISYLRSLDSKLIKSDKRRDDLIAYLERKDQDGSIACYAVRNKLGLRISSNLVEKANDLVVASRQKGKGMSWSREGSWAMASITTMYLNNEESNWRTHKTIQFNMYKDYGQAFDLKNAS